MGNELSTVADTIINISNEIETVATEIYEAEKTIENSIEQTIGELILGDPINRNLALPGIQVVAPPLTDRILSEPDPVPLSDITPEQGSTNPTNEPTEIKPSPDDLVIPIENENGKRNLVPLNNPTENQTENSTVTNNIPSSDSMGGILIDNLLGLVSGIIPTGAILAKTFLTSDQPLSLNSYNPINGKNIRSKIITALLATSTAVASSISPNLYGLMIVATEMLFFSQFANIVNVDIVTGLKLIKNDHGEFSYSEKEFVDPRIFFHDVQDEGVPLQIVPSSRVIQIPELTRLIMNLPWIKEYFHFSAEGFVGSSIVSLPSSENIFKKIFMMFQPRNFEGNREIDVDEYSDLMKTFVYNSATSVLFVIVVGIMYVSYDFATTANEFLTNRVPVLSTERPPVGFITLDYGLNIFLEKFPKMLNVRDPKLARLLTEVMKEFAFLYYSPATKAQAVDILFDQLIPSAFGTDLVSYLGDTASEFSTVIGEQLTNKLLKEVVKTMIDNNLVDIIDGNLNLLGLESGLLKNFNWQPFKNLTSILNDIVIKSSENAFSDLKIIGFTVLPGKSNDNRIMEKEIIEIPENDKIFANLSNEAYKKVDERKNFEEWEYQKDLSDEESAVYRNEKGEQILAVRGTTNLKDSISDIHIIRGTMKDSKRFNKELSKAKELKGLIAVTGHSLGGAISNYISSELGIPSITFNAGYISDKDNLDFTKSKNYKISNDPVSTSLNKGKNFIMKPKKKTFEHSMENFL